MDTPLRIIFMGTPEFAVPTLEALLASNQNVVAVYSQPPRPKGRGQKLQNSPIHALAETHGIPVFTPTSLKSTDAQTELAALNADVAVVVAYGLLLPQVILDAPTHGCINIHPSSLPRWRGAAPIQRTIMAGDSSTEICIMKMDAGLDTGGVYLRSAPIPIPMDMNAGALHDQLAHDAAPLLLEVLNKIAAEKAIAAPQQLEGATYANKITKEDCRIDWNKSAEEIVNHIRGLAPHPGATCLLDGEVLKVYRARIVQNLGESSRTSEVKFHGRVVEEPGDKSKELTILCGDGNTIQLLEVQKAGKPRMSIDAFLRGHGVAKGSVLG